MPLVEGQSGPNIAAIAIQASVVLLFFVVAFAAVGYIGGRLACQSAPRGGFRCVPDRRPTSGSEADSRRVLP